MRWILGLLLAISGLSIGQAQSPDAQSDPAAPPENRWHHVTAGSPFYSDETKAMRVAAILQSDGSFARVILGADDLGAYVTIALPGTTPAPALKSELVHSNGARLTRTVQNTALDTLAMPGAEMTIYSFAIAADDITAFQRAAEWVLTPEGADPVTVSLSGSAAAIDAARAAGTYRPDPETDDHPVLTGLPAATE